MGSYFATARHIGGENAAAAYRILSDAARFESGHAAYNGTISTSSGFFVHQSAPMTETDAHKVGLHIGEDLHKWGEWVAIALGEAETKTKQVRVTVSGGNLESLAEAAKAKAPVGWTVDSAHVVEWTRTLKAPKATSMPAAKALWVVEEGRSKRVFSSKAEALAYAKSYAAERAPVNGNRMVFGFDTTVTVKRMWLTEAGEEATVTVLVPTAKITGVVDVKLSRLKSPKRVGWLFCGWAAE